MDAFFPHILSYPVIFYGGYSYGESWASRRALRLEISQLCICGNDIHEVKQGTFVRLNTRCTPPEVLLVF